MLFILDFLRKVIDSDYFSFVWDFLKILIALILGYAISQWSLKSKEKEATKKFNKNLVQLYDAIRKSEILKIFRILYSINKEKFEDVWDCFMGISHSPEKKDISGSISGKTTISNITNYDPTKTIKEYQEQELNNRLSTDSIDLKIKNQQYISSTAYGNLSIRIDTYDQMIILHPVGSVCLIIDNTTNKQYNLFNQEINQEVLISFLNYLETRYISKDIIKKKTNLDKSIIINEKWKKPSPLPTPLSSSSNVSESNVSDFVNSENKDSANT